MTHHARKLRILCLHGYHGRAEILRAQMQSLIKGTESLAEYVVVDAPALEDGDFGWWHAVNDPGSPAHGDPGVHGGPKYYQGWRRTRDWLVSVFTEQGPFDGAFGFSQGAALTGLLTGLRAPDGKATEERPLVFDFAVIVSGYPSIDPDHAVRYAAKDCFAVPSLHIIGLADSIVPPAKSFDLAAKFSYPVIVQHSGGHVVASTPAVREVYREFLEDKLSGPPVPSVAPIEVPLWPGRERPGMTVVFPERTSGQPTPAIVVFQGGAYATSAGSGAGSAEWIAEQGMVGVRVAYRTQSTLDAFPANYADAARAVRIVRARAAEWDIDPDRIAVLGYSAGGHLASLLSAQPDLTTDQPDDLAGRVSARPDLLILGYPLISFVEQYYPGAFANSVDNFFGRPHVSESLRRDFSNELHVEPTHPPVFVWTTRDDSLVPYTHAQLFAEACQKAQVPVQFELFPHGRHGLGLALDQTNEVRGWTGQLLTWLRTQWGKD